MAEETFDVAPGYTGTSTTIDVAPNQPRVAEPPPPLPPPTYSTPTVDVGRPAGGGGPGTGTGGAPTDITCTRYTERTDVASRLRLALTEAKAAGIPFRRAAIIAAISVNETQTVLLTQRRPGLLYSYRCVNCRPLLKLERQRVTAWVDDEEISRYIEYREQQVGKELVDNNGMATSFLLKTDMVSDPNVELARLFELFIIMRKAAALQYVSIGPTQIYLYYAAITEGGATSKMADRFPTWDSLYSFYTSTLGGAEFGHPAYNYLSTTSTYYPVPGSPRDTFARYLSTYQTGNVDWDDPVWAGYLNRFINSVTTTHSIAGSIGYR